MTSNNIYTRFLAKAKETDIKKDEDLWFIFQDRQIVIKEDMGKIFIPTYKDVKQLVPGLEIEYHLGTLDKTNCYGGEINSSVKIDGELKLVTLRYLAAIIDKELFSVAGKSAQLIHFNKTNKYCGVCGGENKRIEDEFSMTCCNCGFITYPQVCPAIIVGITNGDKILLARNKSFPNDMHSNVAGFVDVNESLEDCVRREVLEEVNIKVKNIRYIGNQPWPYPNSIMIGFLAEYDSGEITVDNKEIMHADWYTKDNLPMLPDKTTIAREIIDFILDNI